MGCPPADKDPAALNQWAPLRWLHREVWLATDEVPPADVTRLGALSQVFQRLNDQRAASQDARRRRQDRLSAAIWAAHEVGWFSSM